LICLAQYQFQFGHSFPQTAQKRWPVFSEQRSRSGQPKFLSALTPQFIGNQFEIFEKRLNEPEEPFTGWRQKKWPSLKQFLAQVFLQLENLATHGRLLDTVRNVMNGSTNSSMLSNKKEELQVMNIHGASTYQSILAVETKSGREQFFCSGSVAERKSWFQQSLAPT
jgi:hypothetical protein